MGRDTCNLACTWCDTRYSWDWAAFSYDEQVMAMHSNEVLERVAALSTPAVVITGGEPLLQQQGLEPLVADLGGTGHTVSVETNGTIAPSKALSATVSHWSVSPKTASSGNPAGKSEVAAALEAFAALPNADWKFVIVERRDLGEAASLAARYGVEPERVVLMPEGTTAAALRERSEWLAAECAERGFRFSSRLHVLLWGAERGV